MGTQSSRHPLSLRAEEIYTDYEVPEPPPLPATESRRRVKLDFSSPRRPEPSVTASQYFTCDPGVNPKRALTADLTDISTTSLTRKPSRGLFLSSIDTSSLPLPPPLPLSPPVQDCCHSGSKSAKKLQDAFDIEVESLRDTELYLRTLVEETLHILFEHIKYGDVPAVQEILLRFDSENVPLIRFANGLTPLHVACIFDQQPMVQFLLYEAEADVGELDACGRSCSQWAEMCGNTAVLRLLREYQRYAASPSSTAATAAAAAAAAAAATPTATVALSLATPMRDRSTAASNDLLLVKSVLPAPTAALSPGTADVAAAMRSFSPMRVSRDIHEVLEQMNHPYSMAPVLDPSSLGCEDEASYVESSKRSKRKAPNLSGAASSHTPHRAASAVAVPTTVSTSVGAAAGTSGAASAAVVVAAEAAETAATTVVHETANEVELINTPDTETPLVEAATNDNDITLLPDFNFRTSPQEGVTLTHAAVVPAPALEQEVVIAKDQAAEPHVALGVGMYSLKIPTERESDADADAVRDSMTRLTIEKIIPFNTYDELLESPEQGDGDVNRCTPVCSSVHPVCSSVHPVCSASNSNTTTLTLPNPNLLLDMQHLSQEDSKYGHLVYITSCTETTMNIFSPKCVSNSSNNRLEHREHGLGLARRGAVDLRSSSEQSTGASSSAAATSFTGHSDSLFQPASSSFVSAATSSMRVSPPSASASASTSASTSTSTSASASASTSASTSDESTLPRVTSWRVPMPRRRRSPSWRGPQPSNFAITAPTPEITREFADAGSESWAESESTSSIETEPPTSERERVVKKKSLRKKVGHLLKVLVPSYTKGSLRK